MKIGTKSVLFGAHQFLLHPLFVAVAWWQLYGFPWDPRLWVAFFVHDLGYWGKPNMDGPEGEEHPWLGARIMGWLFDRGTEAVGLAADELEYNAQSLCDSNTVKGEWVIENELDQFAFDSYADTLWMVDELRKLTRWHDFTLYHSRFMARKHDRQFSRLCVADKLATVLVPAWLYLLMVNLTGEIHEYMSVATHKEGGKYGDEFRDLSSQHAWRASMCDYMRRWIAEHRDGRADTWTPRVEDRCEGCEAVAVTSDREGVPLCKDCAALSEAEEVCEHTGESITQDDANTVARWLPNIAAKDIRTVIRYGLARGLGHAASDEALAKKIAEEWAS